jgi:demethylmenaquinone methyltransferase/2-methoxy-6-polyprenyl-1,4-benzoquinol methylase
MADCSVADISKAPPKIAGMFDAIARRYDVLNHLLSAGIDRRWRNAAVRSLRLTGRERVVDVCTGTADLAIASRAGQPGAARVVGVDFARAMLRVGRDKLRRRGLADVIHLACADATRLPLPAASAEAATIAFGIRNVEDPAAACRELHRVLVPGGRLAILEFAVPSAGPFRAIYMAYLTSVLPWVGRLVSGHDAAYAYLPASVSSFATPAELQAMLRMAGFDAISAQPLTFGAVMLYTARKS